MFVPFDQSIYWSHSWLFDYMNRWPKVSRWPRPRNRSAFRFYVPAGQQSDPIFDWRIQIQISQKECTLNPLNRTSDLIYQLERTKGLRRLAIVLNCFQVLSMIYCWTTNRSLSLFQGFHNIPQGLSINTHLRLSSFSFFISPSRMFTVWRARRQVLNNIKGTKWAVWYENGRRRSLGAQNINTESLFRYCFTA